MRIELMLMSGEEKVLVALVVIVGRVMMVVVVERLAKSIGS